MRMWVCIMAMALVVSLTKSEEFYLRRDKTEQLYGPFNSDEGSQVKQGRAVFTVEKGTASTTTSELTHIAPPAKLTRLVEMMIADGMPRGVLNYGCSRDNAKMGVLGDVNMGTCDDPQTYCFDIIEFTSKDALKKMLPEMEGNSESVVGHRNRFLLMIETKGKAEEILTSFNKCVPKVKADATRAMPPVGPSPAIIGILSGLEANGVALGDVDYMCPDTEHKQGVVTHINASLQGERMYFCSLSDFKTRALLDKHMAEENPPAITVMANQGTLNFAVSSKIVGSMKEAKRIAELFKKLASE